MFLKILTVFVAILAAILYYKGEYTSKSDEALEEDLFTVDRLSKYDGVRSPSLYLSIMGNVFDVTEGAKHYEPGATYNIFVGRDASKSFITGEFEDTGKDLDDISTLSLEDLLSLENWMDMFKTRYIYKGKLIGRFYNDDGTETEYLTRIKIKLEAAKKQKHLKEEKTRRYPPCNVEWDATTGSRVWCSKKSGGVSRDWEGVPRLLHEPGSKEPHCVCINPKQKNIGANLKEYEDCDPTSTSCFIKS